MSKKIFKAINMMLTCVVIMTSLPINVYADGSIADEPDDISVNDLAEISEETDDTGLVEELSDQDEPEVISGMVYDQPLIDEETEVLDADKAAEPVYSVEGGAYTYDADMIDTQDYKELFSAIYNDRRTELFGGRYYTGEQVVSLSGKSGTDVTIKRKSDNTVVNASAVTGAVEYTVTALPWELAGDFSYTVGSLNNEQRTVSANDLTGKKLYAWEYEKRNDGLYERVSVQEITDYRLGDRSGDSWNVSGSVVIDYSKLKNKNNPVAVIAFLYDATKDADFDTVLKKCPVYYYSEDNDLKYYSPVFAALCYSDTDYVKGSDRYRLYEHDPDDEYLNTGSRRYYDDEIYSVDRMGTFSMAPYVYLRDDSEGTVTLFYIQVNDGIGLVYNRMSLSPGELRFTDDMDHYNINDWTIPAEWTDKTTGKTYSVKMASVMQDGERVGGMIYPAMMSGTLTVSNGVGFPDDCSYRFTMNSGLEGIVIEGSAKSVGSNITNMEGMFWGNEVNNNAEKPGSLLGKLDIKALDTSNVTNMSRMFYGQRLSEPLDVTTLNTSKVTDFSYMFYQLYSGNPARNPDVSGFDTSSATNMSYMFAGVGYVGSKVSNNNPAAAHGTFTELDVSNFDFTKVKSIRGMFSNNDKLTKIILPSEPKTGGVEDMSELFMSCSSLTDGSVVNLDKLDTSGCTDMAVMFGCDVREKLIETRKNDKNEVIRTTQHKYGYSLSRGPAFTSLDLSNFNTSKVRDMSGMFDLPYCRSIIFGDGFDVSKVELMQGMFTLPSVRRLDLSGFNTGSLMNASFMFKDMAALTELKLGSLDLSHIESMYSAERMFDGCLTLKELDMSNAVLGTNVYALGKDSIVYLNTDAGGNAEGGCCGLTTLKLPANLPAFAKSPDLPYTMKDKDGNEYTKIAGGNEKALVLTADGATTVDWIFVQDGSGYHSGGLEVGKTKQLAVKIYPYSADQSVTWASSAPAVATVDDDGVITGKKAGKATITATSVLDTSKSAEYEVTVTGQGGQDTPTPTPTPVNDEMEVTSVTLNRTSVSLYPEETFKLLATVSPAGAKDKSVTWSSSDESVAKVDITGKVTAVKAGADTSGNPISATVTITATAKGAASGSTVTASCTVTVQPKEIVDTDTNGKVIDPSASGSGVTVTDESGEANIWVAGIDNTGYYYTGNAIKPALHVYKGYKLLTEGTDYTLAYKNNKNVSKRSSVIVTDNRKKPQVIIKMKGSYSGSETAYFNIIPMPLENLTAVNDVFSVEYKPGKKNLLKPNLMYNGNKVKYGTKDITFKWFITNETGATTTESNCTEPGTYVVKVFAGESGNFSNPTGEGASGHEVARVIVTDKIPMSKVKIAGFKSSLPYAQGKTVSQNAVLTYKDKSGMRTLTEKNAANTSGDYTVKYENNYDLGTATVTYEAAKDESGKYTGKYSGKVVKTYKITGKYTLSESNDKNNGSCSISFVDAADSNRYPYANAAIKPVIKVTATITNNNGKKETRTLVQGKDYTVSYKNNKAVAAADAKKNDKDIAPQVIIKGKGSYVFADTPDMKKGIVKRFAIMKSSLGALVLTISDVAYSKKENGYQKTKILFTDKDYRDLKLKLNRDYTAEFTTSDKSSTPAAGQVVMVTLKATANSSYTGTVTGSYRITDKKTHTDISKAKVVVNPNSNGKTQPCMYTGSGIEPVKDGKPGLNITIGSGKNLKPLEAKKVDGSGKVSGDYEIIGYYNNVQPGNKAVILIRGIGNYRGIRAVKFKISARGVNSRWGGIYGQE